MLSLLYACVSVGVGVCVVNGKINIFDEILTWVNLVLAVCALHHLMGINYFWLLVFTIIYVIFLRRVLLLLTLGLSAFIYYPLSFYYLYVVCDWGFVPAALVCLYLPIKNIVLMILDARRKHLVV